jgi:hypothetical protein
LTIGRENINLFLMPGKSWSHGGSSDDLEKLLFGGVDTAKTRL